MIAQRHKFHRRYFEMARRKMRLFRYKNFTFLFRPTDKSSRFAVVISKKVAKKAVDRNRFRRQTYAQLEQYFLKTGIKVQTIVLYKASGIPENGQAITEAVEAFCQFYTQKQSS